MLGTTPSLHNLKAKIASYHLSRSSSLARQKANCLSFSAEALKSRHSGAPVMFLTGKSILVHSAEATSVAASFFSKIFTFQMFIFRWAASRTQ